MLVITCEHASALIPRSLKPLFQRAEDIVASHRGLDRGALSYARALSVHLGCPLYAGQVSRLVIDLNRSLHHRKLFSEFTQILSSQEKRKLIERYWIPFRQEVHAVLLKNKRVYHLSCHTFTPVFHGVERQCDIGILYDPSRKEEKAFAEKLSTCLKRETSLRVRMNYPYHGRADGHTTGLRREFPGGEYSGIELEVNQALIGGDYWKYVALPVLYRSMRTIVKV